VHAMPIMRPEVVSAHGKLAVGLGVEGAQWPRASVACASDGSRRRFKLREHAVERYRRRGGMTGVRELGESLQGPHGILGRLAPSPIPVDNPVHNRVRLSKMAGSFSRLDWIGEFSSNLLPHDDFCFLLRLRTASFFLAFRRIWISASTRSSTGSCFFAFRRIQTSASSNSSTTSCFCFAMRHSTRSSCTLRPPPKGRLNQEHGGSSISANASRSIMNGPVGTCYTPGGTKPQDGMRSNVS
jgi:hypothetical protein